MSEIEKNKEEFEPFTFIEGDIVDLVAGRSEWAHLVCKWRNSPQVRRYSRNAMPRSLDAVKKRMESPPEGRVREHIMFFIWHKKDRKPIGNVGLNHIQWLNRTANAFLQIGEPDYWGKNIATETTKLLLQYAFEEVNLHSVTGKVAANNVGSWRVAEKMGFIYEGTTKEEFYVDGVYEDVKCYRFLKQDWFKLKESEKKGDQNQGEL